MHNSLTHDHSDGTEHAGNDVPPHFNFGADVVDHYAKDSNLLALLWSNEAGQEERYTYADISALSNRLANVLTENGIVKGDRVVVMLPRIPQWQISLVACLKVGAIPIPCIEMLTARDITFRVQHSGAKAAITTAPNIDKFDACQSSLSVGISVGEASEWLNWESVLAQASDQFVPVSMKADDPAIIYYTSGSTGQPKGVTHASRSLYAWRHSAEHWLDLHQQDVMWCTADTGWSKAGTSILFGPWSRGAAVVFHDGPFIPAQRFALIEQHKVNVFCASATEFRRLTQEDISQFDISSLRLAVTAGESISPSVVAEWIAATQVPLREAYGQTETLMTVLNQPHHAPREGSMGLPAPHLTMAVIDEHGNRLPVNTPGNLALRMPCPQLMLSYWSDPERTEQSQITGPDGDWFVTGDMAQQDEDGYLFYLGRSDDIINSSGYRIGPLEVENALMAHPAVLECAVVASPDKERGEIVKAYIVLRQNFVGNDTLTKELQDFVKQWTAPYKYPRRIEYIPELPKTSTGKVLRRDLKAREYEQL